MESKSGSQGQDQKEREHGDWLARQKRLDDLFYEEMQSELRSRRSHLSRWLMTPFTLLLFGTSLLSLIVLTRVNSDTRYVKIETVSSSILNAIENGADLRAVRNIFENRPLSPKGIRQVFDDMDGHYTGVVPLTKVLEDLRSILFVNGVPSDTLVFAIDSILDEHNERNPFDALEVVQKDYFESLRLKSGDSYPNIQSDVDKVSAELVAKNALVEKYLGRSETSFWISIVAVGLSLTLGAFQIYQNRTSKLVQVLAKAVVVSEKMRQA